MDHYIRLYTWRDQRGNFLTQEGTGDLWIGTPEQLIIRAYLHDAIISEGPVQWDEHIGWATVYGLDDTDTRILYSSSYISPFSMSVMKCRECEGQLGMHSETCSVLITQTERQNIEALETLRKHNES